MRVDCNLKTLGFFFNFFPCFSPKTNFKLVMTGSLSTSLDLSLDILRGFPVPQTYLVLISAQI